MRLASGLVKVTVVTGGGGYSSPPAVTLSGGNGSGASAVAQMNGTAVEAVLVTVPGKDYTSPPAVSFSGGSGSGAAATATVLSYGTTDYVSMFRGRFGELYGVNGHGRGFRWLGTSDYLEPIGITKPVNAPALTVLTGGASAAVRSIAIVNGGAGYFSAPTISFTGGGLTDGSTLHATGRAKVANARVVGITLDARGGAYSSAPQIVFNGGLASGATLSVGVQGSLFGMNAVAPGSGYTLPPYVYVGGGVVSATITTGGTTYGTVAPTISFPTVNGGAAAATCSVSGGRVNAITITQTWAGYTSAPTITFNHATGTGAAATCSLDGLTSAQVQAVIDSAAGLLVGAVISAAGTGATTTPGVGIVSATTVASTTGGSTTLTVGSGGSLSPVVAYEVKSVTVVAGGAGYVAPPAIGFRPTNGGAFAIARVAAGAITSAEVLAGGLYAEPPTATIESVEARAVPYISEPILGKYKCCIRYIDNTPPANGGPRASSISELVDVETDIGGGGLTWRWSNDQAEARVHKIELWRTTADQSLVLYRVAVLSKAGGVLPNTYTDNLGDDGLLDATRSDFAIMPIVMPSGQLNARRFEPPVEYASQGCMFQDRAWYAVDTRGERPNSLWHSEIDEPESAPAAYELVLQESTADPDNLVSIVPFANSLLAIQSRHLYRLQYVAQPIIDASVTLVARRGALNSKCWDVYDGVLFAADSYGLYAFDGSRMEPISVPVDDYWRDRKIDFSKLKHFHVAVSPNDKVVRFYYCRTADGTFPTRALCYCIATQAWWEEEYAQSVTASAHLPLSGRRTLLSGGQGQFLRPAGSTPDVTAAGSSAPVSYVVQFGNQALINEPARDVSLLYTPSDAELQLRLHYNSATTPRANAVDVSRGDGWKVTQGSTAAVLDMSLDRSSLGDAPGFATARYFGRVDDKSSGGDKHLSIALAGQRTTAEVKVHAITVNGVR
jgi:hypothetical protein